jgi:hypothetical protein
MGARARGVPSCSYSCSCSKKLSAIRRQLSANPFASCPQRGTGVPPVFAIRMGTGSRPCRTFFYSRLGQPCYVSSRSTGKPVPHWKPQRGVILSACGQRPRSSSAKREKPCRGDIRGGVAAEIHSAPSGLGRLFGLVPEALPMAMVFRRIAAGGGWRRKMCRPYGAPRAASRCTGADAPAYNVSPLRGWGRSETFIARSFFPRPELDKVTDSMISSLPGVAGYN